MQIKLPEDFSPAEREQKARELFREGYNCCQAVVLAFADILEQNSLATRQILSTIGSGFGGGMARMREVCGSFSGAVVMAGFISPATDITDRACRARNYALVQEMASKFREENGGSIVCRDLLGKKISDSRESPVPSERTAEFYKTRPCERIIGNSARIVAEELAKRATL